ncbi:interleukin-20 receptor subunit beta [Ahaetulla prasina]|uniref:interleukin-20 receptor subunit beta n=1 Tax=Ahaetulla prasina TaxID=499056 RepID=UPI0026493F89|nr:interleukin-20 receptor subunit beta [Ahaetulla prasina]
MAICFLLMICFIWMPFVASAALLSPPQNITILSTNMKHFLIWSPVAETVPGEVVKYSVEFQGEYERDYANDSWIPIAECTYVILTQCDITEDISATVPYNLRVRASMGTQASLWATLNGFFNRVTTSLIPPMLTVTTDGYHLLAELEHLGPAFEFWIFYWKKGPESTVYRKVVRESTTTVHLETMEPGAEYCVKAQTYVEAINRSSNFSEVQCVKSEDAKVILLTFAPLFLVTFFVAVLVLPFLAWKTCRICQYSFCPDEVLPDTLKLTASPAKILKERGEEMEKCDESVQVLPSEEILLHFWIHETL